MSLLLFSSVDGIVVVVVLVVLVWLLVLISRVGVVCSEWFGGFGLGRLGFWTAVGFRVCVVSCDVCIG